MGRDGNFNGRGWGRVFFEWSGAIFLIILSRVIGEVEVGQRSKF